MWNLCNGKSVQCKERFTTGVPLRVSSYKLQLSTNYKLQICDVVVTIRESASQRTILKIHNSSWKHKLS